MIPRTLDEPSRCQAGFTLVEVLVVLALVSLLSGLLFGSLRFGILAWERTTSRSAMVDQNLLVQDFLRRTIAMLYPAFVKDDPSHGHVDFTGTETSMSFVGPTPIARDVGGRSRFVISLEKNGQKQSLTVSAQPQFAAPKAVSNIRDVLVTNVRGVEFSYFGKSRSGRSEWRKDWSSEVTPPTLVRMRIKFPVGDDRVWPELVVKPRTDVDVGCMYDVLTKRCRGR